eukprot:m.202315 g.202315  ORF g.202315 m.202315 type:complete len:55 (+) comp18438_c0_seq6:154-318(+)
MQVAEFHDVIVNEADAPDASCCEIQCCRAAQTTCPNNQDTGSLELFLPWSAKLT